MSTVSARLGSQFPHPLPTPPPTPHPGECGHSLVIHAHVTTAPAVCIQAALQEAHNQNQRLALTVSAMRSDMELMQHHATSPGPQANPAQPPPASSPPSFPPAHDQSPSSCQMQPQPQQQQADGLYTGHVGQHVFQSGLQQQHEQQQGEEVQLLHQQLQDAKAEAEALAEENERLMEMSNALRSECDRSVGRQQQQHVMPVTSFGAQGSVQQPLPLAPELQPQQVYYQPQQAYPLGPHGMPLGQPSTPHAMQWATQGVPHQGLSQHPQLQQALISAQVEGSHQQAWHDVQQPAAGQLAAPSGQHQNGLALTTDDDALPPEVPNLELADLLHHVRQTDLQILELSCTCTVILPSPNLTCKQAQNPKPSCMSSNRCPQS